jgi:hypothetical protein
MALIVTIFVASAAIAAPVKNTVEQKKSPFVSAITAVDNHALIVADTPVPVAESPNIVIASMSQNSFLAQNYEASAETQPSNKGQLTEQPNDVGVQNLYGGVIGAVNLVNDCSDYIQSPSNAIELQQITQLSSNQLQAVNLNEKEGRVKVDNSLQKKNQQSLALVNMNVSVNTARNNVNNRNTATVNGQNFVLAANLNQSTDVVKLK